MATNDPSIPEQFDPGAFERVGLELWRDRVDAELDGAGSQSLAREDADGIAVGPIYEASPDDGVAGEAPFTRGASPIPPAGGWDLRVARTVDDLASARAAILEDLEGGATSILLRPGRALDADALEQLFDGVHLEMITVALDAGSETAAHADALFELWRRRGVAEARAWLGFELGGGELDAAAATIDRCSTGYPGVKALIADGTRDARTPARALGLMLVDAIALLRAMEERGVAPERSAAQLTFRLPASSRFFTTIAAVRALRLLWSQIQRRAALSPRPAVIELHAGAQGAASDNEDAEMLRGTVATFAGAVAGADAITGRPYAAGPIARRLDRNTHHVLRDEADLGSVVDPAGGSGYLEELTRALARRAWEHVQESR